MRNVSSRTKIKIIPQTGPYPLVEVDSRVSGILNEGTNRKTNLFPQDIQKLERQIGDSMQ